MDQFNDPKKENAEMLENTIKQFMEATRQYLFQMMPTQAKLATVPVRRVHH